MMKKLTALILSVLLIMTAIAVPAMAASISTTVKTTNKGDVLNVRKGPHKGNTPVVDYVQNGTKITLLTTDDDDDPEAWNKIKVDKTGAIGYLKNKYIKYFGLSNAGGEIDRREDDDWDYSDSYDNDGRGGSGSALDSSGSGSKKKELVRFALVSCRVGGSVNVRAGAGTKHRVVGTATNGELMRVERDGNDWYRAAFIDKRLDGYIHADYVVEGVPAELTSSGVNLRKGPGTSHTSLRKLSKGESVTLLAEEGDWYEIQIGRTTGWVFYKYLMIL